jgi:hypothetical protein
MQHEAEAKAKAISDLQYLHQQLSRLENLSQENHFLRTELNKIPSVIRWFFT